MAITSLSSLHLCALKATREDGMTVLLSMLLEASEPSLRTILCEVLSQHWLSSPVERPGPGHALLRRLLSVS